jgi:transposase InsO family protein
VETNNTLNTYRTDNMHPNARLTPLGRAEMINDVTQTGSTCRAVATARHVDEKTVRKWLKRAAEEPGERLYDHSCVPIHQPRRTSPEREAQVVALRRHRLTYLRIAEATGLSKATISRILKRHGLNRLSLLDPPPPPVRRYEYEEPGGLLHLDIKSLVCFDQPGHRATGDRTKQGRNVGRESVHVCIDDHSRLAFAQVLPDERKATTAGFLEAALAFFADYGVKVQRILTDNGPSYHSDPVKAVCRNHHIKHIHTRPYRPQTNGKAERFIQTLIREWAYGRTYSSSTERAAWLPAYIHDYNWHRPHGALYKNPPISRIPLSADNVSRLHI